MFKNLPLEYSCLQVKLNFYNKNENILTYSQKCLI
ncbi:hypothetical protein RPO_05405 [Rickettsia rickettsii str. Arizona]|uniref:Uncharacterized protein n=2 Tax=spotted fever group TaxID=114277 RepID=A0A0H3AXS4_RICRS|nr:hypothetical protein A1G_05340 [Rickettsia rickettsii str. 'Sheila Smith']AFB21873.1 hypothetical protein RPN_01650 [Rickettsia rickettsii str. Brazil]AFB23909.1 hypothetical protein RPL_05385 [Rickettsia rickettsii str. Colombia]AFB25255.1 hypothetical protein RPO_05405 [Rickettsia rickettsii str. Arizona]AFB26594.1 hypothetical protein RSA_05365 [Rickettsia philipii str. 364D]AFB27933.1 hypothetical protein RPJ_05345 [Rickettsia rickettsii str. Hino]AFB29258.1 hypothetical protein RPK_05